MKKTEYIYSNTNRLLKMVEKMYDGEGTELIQKTVRYIYDNNGNELRQTVCYILPHNMKMRQKTEGNVMGDGVTQDISSIIERTSNTFDGFNRLKSTTRIRDGVRTTAEYTYNGDDLRVKKVVKRSDENYTANTTNYLYDRQHIVLETNEADNVVTRYVKGINYIAQVSSTNKTSYFMFNSHGDVVHTVKEDGTVENNYEYDIFGNSTLTIEQYSSSIRYAGYQYDEETGLYYLNARYYDSKIARFISEDTYRGTANDPLSLNLYTYCSNNPIKYIDPTGHWQQDDELLSAWAQDRIVELTDAYYEAASDEERASIHTQADAIRNDPANLLSNIIHNKDNTQFVSAVDTEIETSKYGYMTADTWAYNSVNYKKSNVVVSASDEEIIQAYDLIEMFGDTAASVSTMLTQRESLGIFGLDIGAGLSDYAIPNGYSKMENLEYAMLYNKVIGSDLALSGTIIDSLYNGIPTSSRYTDSLRGSLNRNSYYNNVWNTERTNMAKGYVSTLLDFIPIVDDIKMLIETGAGKDYITNRDIGWGEKGINAIVGLFAVKGLTKVDDLFRSTKNIDNVKNAAILPVKAGEAGSFGDLAARSVRGDKLTPHHMPQAAANYTSYSKGGALVLPETEHFMTRTFGGKGSVTLVEDAGLSFRQTLYKDITDIRSIAGSKYNKGLMNLIDNYEQTFPGLMKK